MYGIWSLYLHVFFLQELVPWTDVLLCLLRLHFASKHTSYVRKPFLLSGRLDFVFACVHHEEQNIESWKHSSHHPKRLAFQTALLCKVIGFRTFGSFLGNWTGGLTSWGSQHRSLTCESERLDICKSLATFGCSPGFTYFTVLKSQWCMNLLPDAFARVKVICVLTTVINVFPRGLNLLYWWLYLDMEAWTAQMRTMFVHRKLPSGQPGVSLLCSSRKPSRNIAGTLLHVDNRKSDRQSNISLRTWHKTPSCLLILMSNWSNLLQTSQAGGFFCVGVESNHIKSNASNSTSYHLPVT